MTPVYLKSPCLHCSPQMRRLYKRNEHHVTNRFLVPATPAELRMDQQCWSSMAWTPVSCLYRSVGLEAPAGAGCPPATWNPGSSLHAPRGGSTSCQSFQPELAGTPALCFMQVEVTNLQMSGLCRALQQFLVHPISVLLKVV